MARSITQDKARAIAQAYCTNGFHKKDALLSVGYKEPFSKSTVGSRIFDKPIVRAEIDQIMERNAEVVDVEIEEIVRGLREIAFPEPDEHVNNSDRNRALELLGKFKSMFSDRLTLGETEQQRELNENETREAKILASLRLKMSEDGVKKLMGDEYEPEPRMF